MADSKKTLRLSDGKRSARAETAKASRPPRAHKPWSQTLAKKRPPRVATETEKTGAASSERHTTEKFLLSPAGGKQTPVGFADTPFKKGASSSRPPRDEKHGHSENERSESRPRYGEKTGEKVFEYRENVENAKTRNTKTENFKAKRADAPAKKTASSSSPPLEGVRVSKLLSSRGLCSRREADEYIERGWVRVNGQRVALGARAQPDDNITLSPQAKTQQARRVTILLHKPAGYVSGQPEPGYQPAIVLIKPENQCQQDSDPPFSATHLRHLAPAGRLDIDSIGLLVLTQDGRVARDLIGETSSIDKEYLVRVEGALSDANLALLNHGLSLDGEVLKPAKVEWLNGDQLRFVLREGKKRQIRRMCEAVGLTVTGLKRVRIGRVRLGDLPLGQWRYLRDDESFGHSER
jgi:23S rRNA pseudouridine2604 synthase